MIPNLGAGQRDAGPSSNMRWVYSFSGLVNEVSVSPPAKQAFPPRVTGLSKQLDHNIIGFRKLIFPLKSIVFFRDF